MSAMTTSISDEDGSCTENDLVEASETELQNFACDIKEGDYYAYVKDEVCYVNGDEGSDYEFDESELNQQLDYKFDNLDWGYSDSKGFRVTWMS
ncbi:putative ubiquitin-conjugating enzyme E2 38 [Hordeum vulgare]|nr:putative ubiquitin-conjugating enzyme E2 38 [Hordeum vulgare]